MNEKGIKIKNIKAGTLYGCQLGVRTAFDANDGVFSNSLLCIYLKKHGLTIDKGNRTRDLICLDFDFGSRSYEEEMEHLKKLQNKTSDTAALARITQIMKNVTENKDLYIKKSKEEIRTLFYENGVCVNWPDETIHYRMLYRNSAKAKLGQVMFIRDELYPAAYDWLTMGLGPKLPPDNAKIVELSAYAPLTASTIIDTLHIPVSDILILKDQDSFFTTLANIVKAAPSKDDPDIKTCIVSEEITDIKNTLWDGMGLIEDSFLPPWVNGMALMRNHFFKMCGFRSKIQQFFKDWCIKKGLDYDTVQIKDMFGIPHSLKDIKVITTDNAIKWKKFVSLMGDSLPLAYDYWCHRVTSDGSIFGIVKTDHRSKLGQVQQMSYQMINTLPCTKADVCTIAETSMAYVARLKSDTDTFEQFLRQNANGVNHYEMIADLYRHNPRFADSAWFRHEKRQIINKYVTKLRSGKITVHGDNLTVCGNPYGLLLYAVGEDYTKDPAFCIENGAVQCYTTRFSFDTYLCAFRNPHNSPNGIACLHNVYTAEMEKYFPFGDNILAVNCIHTDIQDRMNGCDFDSDFFFVTNQQTLVHYAKHCVLHYPTIVNRLNESNIIYPNTKAAFADMDNRFAKARRGIGQSSNLAQLALTYYWTAPSRVLYDNFIILSVLAQVIIDGCKREYEIDALKEIDRIKSLPCMNPAARTKNNESNVRSGSIWPKFMKYTKEVPTVKNGSELPYETIKAQKDKISDKINDGLTCPMNWLQDCLDSLPPSPKRRCIPTKNFFIKMPGKASARQMTKIRSQVEAYDAFIKINHDRFGDEGFALEFETVSNQLLNDLRRIKISSDTTINRLIETALALDSKNNNPDCHSNQGSKYSKRLLNTLYKMDRSRFLKNFVTETEELSRTK